MSFLKWTKEIKKKLEEEQVQVGIDNSSLITRIDMALVVYEAYMQQSAHKMGLSRDCCAYSGPPFVRCETCGGRQSL